MAWHALVRKILEHKNIHIHFHENVTYFLLRTHFECTAAMAVAVASVVAQTLNLNYTNCHSTVAFAITINYEWVQSISFTLLCYIMNY